MSGRAFLAIQCFGEDARSGGLADAARACKNIRVRKPVFFDRAFELSRDVVLTDDFIKICRPPLEGKNCIRHRANLFAHSQPAYCVTAAKDLR
jgi:hypothetical protein